MVRDRGFRKQICRRQPDDRQQYLDVAASACGKQEAENQDNGDDSPAHAVSPAGRLLFIDRQVQIVGRVIQRAGDCEQCKQVWNNRSASRDPGGPQAVDAGGEHESNACGA